MKRVIFISGKYRGKDYAEIEANIQLAKNAAIRLWREGYAVITPHLNTAHFDGLADDTVWLEGDLEILSRVDCIYMLKNWDTSAGAVEEHRQALLAGKEVIYEAEGG
jgi:hypothetical protein